ncbi:MAG: hypothetical protein PHR81_00615 [Bacteroidales bacterium]|jgi:hypothetical protein|nr:hypothetical protein [Bacteroidales bacterium]MDD4213290.1 hypothetical protein [Bacteroidales bacterium]
MKTSALNLYRSFVKVSVVLLYIVTLGSVNASSLTTSPKSNDPAIPPAQISITLTPYVYPNGFNTSCFGYKDGSINLTVSWGKAPYHFKWSNGETTEDISGLPAGYYKVVVVDSKNNEATAEITLQEPDPKQQPEIASTVYMYPNGYNISCYNCFNGIIELTVTGGSGNYGFDWSDGAVTQDRAGLGAGEYSVTISDNSSCGNGEKYYLSFNLREPGKEGWTMDGNYNTSPPGQFIGTADNNDLVFKTNGMERLTISKDGNVGVGVNNPDTKLGVNGNMNITGILKSDSLAGDGFKFDSTSAKSYNLVYADEVGTIITLSDPFVVGTQIHFCGTPSTAWFLGGNQINSTNANANYIGTCNYRPFRIFTNGSERFRITEDGNLGIGTDDPENYKAKIDAGEDNGLWIKTTHGNSQYGYCFKMDVDRDDTKAMAVWNSGIENFLVYGSGRVFAREITVSLGTLGDFVFDKDYNLMTIRDLEKFIYKNHHLPGIPSANEVNSNGLNVGEFQNLLLQKIEELTLYVIELNKKNEEMEKEISKLKNENKND